MSAAIKIHVHDWLNPATPIEQLCEILALVHAHPNLDWCLCSEQKDHTMRVTYAMLHLDAKRPNPTSEEFKQMRLDSARMAPEAFSAKWARFKRSPLSLWLGDWLEGNQPANVTLLRTPNTHTP